MLNGDVCHLARVLVVVIEEGGSTPIWKRAHARKRGSDEIPKLISPIPPPAVIVAGVGQADGPLRLDAA